MNIVSARDVANYFLSRVDPEDGETISHLKLQKLVYYAQGFHLAITGEPLFHDRIEAWRHGPVVPELYHQFKQHGYSALPIDGVEEAAERFSPEQREILDEVYDVYGAFSAWKLRDMTHEEAPWKDADRSGPSEEITHDALRRFFKTRVSE